MYFNKKEYYKLITGFGEYMDLQGPSDKDQYIWIYIYQTNTT